MALIIVISIYLAAFLLLIALLRPMMRRLGVSYILFQFSGWFLLTFYLFLRNDMFGTVSGLYYLPWPAPQASSSVAALDYTYGTDWYSLLQYIWYAGMGVYAVGLIIHTLLFRRRIGQSSTPAPDHIADTAMQIFIEMKQAELTAKLKSDAEREPTAEELAECEKVKLPRLLVSSTVDGPLYFAWRKTLVLPDNISYTDRQLHFILSHAYRLVEHGHIRFSWLHIIAMCAGWFNPLFYLLRRMECPGDAIARDSALAADLTPAEKDEYIATLRSLSNPQRPSIHYCLIAGQESEANLRTEYLSVKKIKDRLLSVTALILIPLFFFGMSHLIQPSRQYPVNEESIFAILGENPARLYSEKLAPIPLFSTEADGLLYGTPHYLAISHNTVFGLNFQYSPDIPSEELLTNFQRVYDALCARLGEPGAPLKITGALSENIDQPLPMRQEDNYLFHCKWTVPTKDGDQSTLTLILYKDGAYLNSEVKGGPYIDIDLY